jgi:hypothetical protein
LRDVFFILYFPRDVTTAMKRIKAEGQALEGPWVFCLLGKETQADRVPIMHYFACMGWIIKLQKGTNKRAITSRVRLCMYVCAFNHTLARPLFNRKLGSKPFST